MTTQTNIMLALLVAAAAPNLLACEASCEEKLSCGVYKEPSGSGGGGMGGSAQGGGGMGGAGGGVERQPVIRKLAAGFKHTCAVANDTTVWCWGNNPNGQLGHGEAGESGVPVQVLGLTGVFSVVANALGNHTCAIADSEVYCWGRNLQGQLGNGETDDEFAPISTGITDAVDLAVGTLHSCAMIKDGKVYCWGANDDGQLGDGTFESVLTPTLTVVPSPLEVSGGFGHNCGLFESSGGSAWCWGRNTNGQLGDGSDNISPVPVQVATSGSVLQVAAGSTYSCAVIEDQSVECWGKNALYELGVEMPLSTMSPIAVENLTGAVRVAAGFQHTCAVLDNGTLRCWGDNSFGQMGNINAQSPSLQVPVIGVSDVEFVALGSGHSCAMTVDGSVRCWGANDVGQLGDGTTDDTIDPVTPMF